MDDTKYCPKCGADRTYDYGTGQAYECGTRVRSGIVDDETWRCLRRQVARLQAVIDTMHPGHRRLARWWSDRWFFVLLGVVTLVVIVCLVLSQLWQVGMAWPAP